MKKHLSLLFLLAAVVGLSAKTIDTKDLTVTAPDTWIAESSDVGYPISSLVTMSNAPSHSNALPPPGESSHNGQSYLYSSFRADYP